MIHEIIYHYKCSLWISVFPNERRIEIDINSSILFFIGVRKLMAKFKKCMLSNIFYFANLKYTRCYELFPMSHILHAQHMHA
jgi:hypothetical protein